MEGFEDLPRLLDAGLQLLQLLPALFEELVELVQLLRVVGVRLHLRSHLLVLLAHVDVALVPLLRDMVHQEPPDLQGLAHQGLLGTRHVHHDHGELARVLAPVLDGVVQVQVLQDLGLGRLEGVAPLHPLGDDLVDVHAGEGAELGVRLLQVLELAHALGEDALDVLPGGLDGRLVRRHGGHVLAPV